MRYISTRGQTEPVGFQDAVMMGLATDGGLLLPASIPDVRAKLDSWRTLSYEPLAFEVLRLFADDLPACDLRKLVNGAYAGFRHDEVAPVVTAGGTNILELFHGPTLAFKDFALQFLGRLFEYILQQRGSKLTILGATSGDTGSAAIHGLRGRSNIEIFIMHPHQRVSELQELQMTSVLDANVHNLAIRGTFDDGQRIMKSLFRDLAFKGQYALGAVNSVNWARVLAQVVYYFYGTFRVLEREGGDSVVVSVPTGNFGDVFAGYLAKRMGAPIEQLIVATNENDILARFFQSGVYAQGDVAKTLSPSMDIQVASNFERYLYYQQGECAQSVRELMQTFSDTGSLAIDAGPDGVDAAFSSRAVNTAETLATIARVNDSCGYVLDPHSAVGVAAAETVPGDRPTLCLATAHPAKFPDAIAQAVPSARVIHPVLERLKGVQTRCEVIDADEGTVRETIARTLA